MIKTSNVKCIKVSNQSAPTMLQFAHCKPVTCWITLPIQCS